jgi:MFS family permease
MSPLFLIFLALFNSILGLSVLFPVMGPLGRELGLGELEVGSLSTAYSLMQFVASPFWGRKSERAGRKPVLLTGILGFAATFFAFGGVAHLGLEGVVRGPFLFLALLGTRLVGGAYSSATMPTAQAYVADVTDRGARTGGMAVVGAAFGLGLVVGPAIGALLAPFGLLVPVYVSSAIALANALFVVLWVPEPERRQSSVPPLPLSLLAARGRMLLGIGFVTTVAAVAMEQTVAFHFQDRLALSGEGTARAVGLSLVVYGVVAVLVQGFFVRRIGWAPLTLVRMGVPIAAIGLVALALAETEPLLVMSMALQGVGQGLAHPGVTAALSLGASENEQGPIAGLNSSSQALGRTLGPVLGTGLYELRPAYPYAFGAALLALVFGFLLVRRASDAGTRPA